MLYSDEVCALLSLAFLFRGNLILLTISPLLHLHYFSFLQSPSDRLFFTMARLSLSLYGDDD